MAFGLDDKAFEFIFLDSAVAFVLPQPFDVRGRKQL
jgi:hypothetical protein